MALLHSQKGLYLQLWLLLPAWSNGGVMGWQLYLQELLTTLVALCDLQPLLPITLSWRGVGRAIGLWQHQSSMYAHYIVLFRTQ